MAWLAMAIASGRPVRNTVSPTDPCDIESTARVSAGVEGSPSWRFAAFIGAGS